MDTKRISITTILGLVAGLLCYWGGLNAGISFTTGMMLGTILNRTYIGFVIGLSKWKINYLLHGVVIGVIGTLPMAIYAVDAPATAVRSIITLLLFGALWGLLIELLATKVLKAPMQ